MVKRAETEWTNPDPPDALLSEPPLEFENQPLEALAAEREQEADLLTAQTTGHEREREFRRRIEPLHVVDRDDDGGRLCRCAQGSEHGERDRGLIRRSAFGICPPQRNPERAPLRRGKCCQRLVEDRIVHPDGLLLARERTRGDVRRVGEGGPRGGALSGTEDLHLHGWQQKRVRAAPSTLPIDRLGTAPNGPGHIQREAAASGDDEELVFANGASA